MTFEMRACIGLSSHRCQPSCTTYQRWPISLWSPLYMSKFFITSYLQHIWVEFSSIFVSKSQSNGNLQIPPLPYQWRVNFSRCASQHVRGAILSTPWIVYSNCVDGQRVAVRGHVFETSLSTSRNRTTIIHTSSPRNGCFNGVNESDCRVVLTSGYRL